MAETGLGTLMRHFFMVSGLLAGVSSSSLTLVLLVHCSVSIRDPLHFRATGSSGLRI